MASSLEERISTLGDLLEKIPPSRRQRLGRSPRLSLRRRLPYD